MFNIFLLLALSIFYFVSLELFIIFHIFIHSDVTNSLVLQLVVFLIQSHSRFSPIQDSALFEIRSHSGFSPFEIQSIRDSVPFEIQSFEIQSFEIQSFGIRSFGIRSFEIQSVYHCYLSTIGCPVS